MHLTTMRHHFMYGILCPYCKITVTARGKSSHNKGKEHKKNSEAFFM